MCTYTSFYFRWEQNYFIAHYNIFCCFRCIFTNYHRCSYTLITLEDKETAKQDNSQESPDQDYEVPDYETMLHAAESPHVMKSNIAYSSILSGQLRSTDVLGSELLHSDMKPNIAYGCITSNQHCNDVVPSETQYYSEVSTL